MTWRTALLDEADADIRGHRGYFDYLVMLYRSRVARRSGDLEQARTSIRDAVSRLQVEGRVVYLLDVLPEAVAVLHALEKHEQADQAVRRAAVLAADDGPADAPDGLGCPAGVVRQRSGGRGLAAA